MSWRFCVVPSPENQQAASFRGGACSAWRKACCASFVNAVGYRRRILDVLTSLAAEEAVD